MSLFYERSETAGTVEIYYATWPSFLLLLCIAGLFLSYIAKDMGALLSISAPSPSSKTSISLLTRTPVNSSFAWPRRSAGNCRQVSFEERAISNRLAS